MSSANDSFISNLSNLDGFYFLLFAIALARTSDTMLNKSGHIGQEGSFTERLGVVSHLLSAQSPGGWQSAKNHLSNYPSPMGPRNESPPGHQELVIKGWTVGSSCKNQGAGFKNQGTGSGTLEHGRGRAWRLVLAIQGLWKVLQSTPRCVFN